MGWVGWVVGFSLLPKSEVAGRIFFFDLFGASVSFAKKRPFATSVFSLPSRTHPYVGTSVRSYDMKMKMNTR